MYLSYSGFSKAIACGFAYWNEYLGKTELTEPDDRLGSIYGSSVGRLFEDFYRKKVWKQKEPQAFLMSRVEETVDKVIERETTPWKDRKGGVLLWKGTGEGQNPKALYETKEELVADVKDAVARGFRIIRHHRLLGPRADAEFKLDYETPEGHIIAGRADFILERTKPHNDLVIIDGKGSRHRDKYVDPQQLLWYAMLFWLHSKKEGKPRLPNRLAFLYWRFEPDRSMDWIDVSEDEVKALYEQTLDTISEIEKREKYAAHASAEQARGVFLPKADDQNCRFCPYTSVCPPGRKITEKKKRK